MRSLNSIHADCHTLLCLDLNVNGPRPKSEMVPFYYNCLFFELSKLQFCFVACHNMSQEADFSMDNYFLGGTTLYQCNGTSKIKKLIE